MNDLIIVARKLSHTYRSAARQKAALIDVDLEVARGSCVAIIGTNGSGKSTLIQHFNGLLRPTSGSITVDGVDVAAAGRRELTLLRRRVGMLFQFPEAQLFERTVYADVAFGPQRLGLPRGEIHDRVLAALETVGLPAGEFAERSPFELSGGQMRRVALAGVLAASPTLLVLDEPTVGLDAEGRSEFYSYLWRAREREGATIALVSHDMAEVASLADRVFVLHQGRLVMEGAPRDVFARGEQLRGWGLVQPPLVELLGALRQRGVPIPEDVCTLEGALESLKGVRRGTCSKTCR